VVIVWAAREFDIITPDELRLNYNLEARASFGRHRILEKQNWLQMAHNSEI